MHALRVCFIISIRSKWKFRFLCWKYSVCKFYRNQVKLTVLHFSNASSHLPGWWQTSSPFRIVLPPLYSIGVFKFESTKSFSVSTTASSFKDMILKQLSLEQLNSPKFGQLTSFGGKIRLVPALIELIISYITTEFVWIGSCFCKTQKNWTK